MTTGWFMPAGGQLLDAISNLTGLQFDESNVQASSAVGGWEGCLSWMGMGSVASLMNSAMEKVSFTNKITFAPAGNGIQIAAQSSPTRYRYIDFADGGWIEYHLKGLRHNSPFLLTHLSASHFAGRIC